MKLQDLTLKQISTLCANQDTCSDCPLWSKKYHRCWLDRSFAPYSFSQELFDVEMPDDFKEDYWKDKYPR